MPRRLLSQDLSDITKGKYIFNVLGNFFKKTNLTAECHSDGRQMDPFIFGRKLGLKVHVNAVSPSATTVQCFIHRFDLCAKVLPPMLSSCFNRVIRFVDFIEISVLSRRLFKLLCEDLDHPEGSLPMLPGDRFTRVVNPAMPLRFDSMDGSVLPTPYQYPLTYGQMTPATHPIGSQHASNVCMTTTAMSAIHPAQSLNFQAPPVGPQQQRLLTVLGPPQPQLPFHHPQGTALVATPGGHHHQSQQFQRLKVEDALSYLDQVKLQFGNMPSVYNDFLDIMKEFKSQTIDTPGVISRVSNLFKGHPDLVVGFNTFLPPGYKIEVDRDVISVQQPGQRSMPIAALSACVSSSQQHLLAVAQKAAVSLTTPVTGSASHGYGQPLRALNPPGAGGPVGAHQCHPQSSAGCSVAQLTCDGGGGGGDGGQPVEFNHAITYVNKIKNRFQGQPEVYKQFLEILHTYQKEQRTIKERCDIGHMVSTVSKPLTETEVYSQVARLFQEQEDLLAEFGQFLPDANSPGGSYLFGGEGPDVKQVVDMDVPPLSIPSDHIATVKKQTLPPSKLPSGKSGSQLKRPVPCGRTVLTTPVKRYKTGVLKDVSMAEAGKYASLKEYAFFDQVRNALRSNDVYNNFLRCIVLFNMEVVSRSELITMTQPFLWRNPELYKWFKEFLGHRESGGAVEPVPPAAAKDRGLRNQFSMEIDYQSCKRTGASYRALPSSYPQPSCSGCTALCREVLNDVWVSIPTWSEDSTFVTSRKSQFEEYIYKCEDERFELDVVIETNWSTVKLLEFVLKKMQRMSPEEATKFRLDNTLGGSSETIARKAVSRLYGEKAIDIVEGLKTNPAVAVPLVLRRLKAKDAEWRDAQKGFNKLWREQNERYYLKSLDQQAAPYKQNDVKALRSKALINDIETIMDERTISMQRSQGVDSPHSSPPEPHIVEIYEDKSVFEDVASVIVHNMKRQSNIQQEDKLRIKRLVYHHVRHFLFYPRGDLSDDEDDDRDPVKSVAERSAVPPDRVKTEHPEPAADCDSCGQAAYDSCLDCSQPLAALSAALDRVDGEDAMETCHVFFANNFWYVFFRLHYKLCRRLLYFRRMAGEIAEKERNSRSLRRPSTAEAIALKTPFPVAADDYYAYFLECIKNLLDCSVESGVFEDQLREMFGTMAYPAFTVDKLVINIVRTLTSLVGEEGMELLELYQDETRGSLACVAVPQPAVVRQQVDGAVPQPAVVNQKADGAVPQPAMVKQQAEMNYQRRAEAIIADDNCYKFTFTRNGGAQLISLVDHGGEIAEEAGEVERWVSYIDRYVGMVTTEKFPDHLVQQLRQKPLFLIRNVMQWRAAMASQMSVDEDDDEEEEGEMDDDDDVDEEEECTGSEEDGKPKAASRVHRRQRLPSLNWHFQECLKDVHEGRTYFYDGAGVKFNMSSLKMHWVCWGNDVLYRISSLEKARLTHRRISLGKQRKFLRWLSTCHWQKEAEMPENADQDKQCNDWLLGVGPDYCSSVTTTPVEMNSPPTKLPYHSYTRYCVVRHQLPGVKRTTVATSSLPLSLLSSRTRLLSDAEVK